MGVLNLFAFFWNTNELILFRCWKNIQGHQEPKQMQGDSLGCRQCNQTLSWKVWHLSMINLPQIKHLEVSRNLRIDQWYMTFLVGQNASKLLIFSFPVVEGLSNIIWIPPQMTLAYRKGLSISTIHMLECSFDAGIQVGLIERGHDMWQILREK